MDALWFIVVVDRLSMWLDAVSCADYQAGQQAQSASAGFIIGWKGGGIQACWSIVVQQGLVQKGRLVRQHTPDLAHPRAQQQVRDANG
jgi:hypothetical protein